MYQAQLLDTALIDVQSAPNYDRKSPGCKIMTNIVKGGGTAELKIVVHFSSALNTSLYPLDREYASMKSNPELISSTYICGIYFGSEFVDDSSSIELLSVCHQPALRCPLVWANDDVLNHLDTL